MLVSRCLPRATPALGTDAYEAWRDRALANSETKRLNFQEYLTSPRTSSPSFNPLKIDIEPISRCNFRCTMCVVSEWTHGKRAEDMTFEQFRALIDSEPQLLEIKLQGLGEPLMLGEELFKMISYAISRDIWVRTTTNASLLHQKGNYKKLVDSGVCEVQISIDGATPETFESVRVGAHSNRVFDNCRLINAYCTEKTRHVTKMWTVVEQDNYREMELLVDTAADLGFKSQVFSLDLHGWGTSKWNEINLVKRRDNHLDESYLLGLVEKGKSVGVRVEFWTVNDKYDATSPETLCPWPFERSMVSSDLRTVPCCMISNPDVFELGKGMDFASAWHGSHYAQFRKAHLSGDIPKVCRSCYK